VTLPVSTTSGHIWQRIVGNGKINTSPGQYLVEVRLVPKFKKRNIERKGGKKVENLEMKLIKNNLKDLAGTGGESEE
jgi:hypothetical protein